MKPYFTRLYLVSFLFIVIVAISVNSLYDRSQKGLAKEIANSIEYKVDLVVHEINQGINETVNDLMTLERLIRFGAGESIILDILIDMTKENESLLSIYTGSPSNVMLNGSGWIPPKDFDLRTRPWYEMALAKGGLILTAPYLNASKDNWIVTLAKPVFDEDLRLLCVIGADRSILNLLDFMEKESPSKNGINYLIDSTGMIVSDEATTRESHYNIKDVFGEEVVSLVINEESGTIKVYKEDNKGNLRWKRVDSLDVIVISFAPKSDFDDTSRELASTYFASIAVVLLFIGVIYLMQKSFVVKPLTHLELDIKAISLQTDPSYRLTTDEDCPFNNTRETLNTILNDSQNYLENLEDKQAEIEELNEVLTLAKGEVELANKAKSEFLSLISHELRTPLNGMMGFNSLLKTTALDQDQSEYVALADESGKRLLNVVNDILDYTKLESEANSIKNSRVNIHHVFDEIFADNISKARVKGIVLSLDLDGDLPVYAWIDPIWFKKVIQKLVGNAIKFTEHGRVEIKVLYEYITSNHGRVFVKIKDTGIGISEDKRTKLFKPFSQLDQSDTRSYQGVGMGLALVAKAVKEMGGTLDFSSELGKGSNFFFDITIRVH